MIKFKRIVAALAMLVISVVAGAVAAPIGASANPPNGWHQYIGVESGKCLTVHGAGPYVNGTVVDIFTCVTPVQDNQLWNIFPIYDGNGNQYGWSISSKVGNVFGRLLTVHGSPPYLDGTITEIWDPTPPSGQLQSNQVWYPTAGSPYAFNNAGAGRVLTVHGGGAVNNTPVDIWQDYGQNNQRWYVV